MKVRELIETLQQQNPDDEVVMAKDSEGNSYSPLHGMWAGTYVPETTWYGSVYLRELTDEDRKQGYTVEDVWPRKYDEDDPDSWNEWNDEGKEGVHAIILTPVN